MSILDLLGGGACFEQAAIYPGMIYHQSRESEQPARKLTIRNCIGKGANNIIVLYFQDLQPDQGPAKIYSFVAPHMFWASVLGTLSQRWMMAYCIGSSLPHVSK
jgi:hypothetical protein